MFHDIQRWGFAKQPAGKYALPLIVTGPIGRPFIDQQLHKRTLLGCQFPRRRSLARTQADNRPSDTDRLTRPKLYIPRQSVALVEEAERCNAFRHGCPDLFSHGCHQIIIGGCRRGFFSRLAGCFFFDMIAAEPATAG